MTDFRYKGFVSYSWADAEWGKWLHQAIETYRTPAVLVGKEVPAGPVPARLHPLFKDREEEAAGASIGKAVETALASSEFLIVICSPRSAQSKWVNHEIAWFKIHRDPAKILALIVDGEPGSTSADCFPKALTHRVLPDLTITDEREDAPLAADARDSGDGKRRARLKIAAAMLGVGLDELLRRDDHRRAVRARIVVAASLALAAVMTGMAVFAVQQRNDARYQRGQSDGLVEFMLTDLREKLEPVGRLDALDVVGQRALAYYAQQKPGDLDADALGRRSRALHLVGEVRNIRGDSVGALTAFRQAAATTSELLARDPDNQQRIFDHAQSVFWVGYIAYERKETKEAEAQFREYKRLADRLVALDPRKPEWQMEVSYAESNLGVLFNDQGRYAEAEPAFARALGIVETVAAGEKRDAARQLEVGVAMSWLGLARAGVGKIAEALDLHRREITTYETVLKDDPANSRAKWLEAVAWQHVGELEQFRGNVAASITAYGTSLNEMRELRALEPGNTEWQETEVRAMNEQVDNLTFQGQAAAAQQVYDGAMASLDKMMAADPKNTTWSGELRASLKVKGARLALAQGNLQQALNRARDSKMHLAAGLSSQSPAAARIACEAAILVGDAEARLGRRADAISVWLDALAQLDRQPVDLLAQNQRSRFLLLKRLGKIAEAQAIAVALDRQGYRHPAYLRER